MNFIHLEFVAFFTVVFISYWQLSRRLQNIGLVIASFVFYGWVHPWFVLLLLYSATLDYCCGLGMARWPQHKGRLLAVSVVGNVALLGTFKYLDFFILNFVAASEALGVHADVHTLGLLLPVGISFFTFQTLSYTIDIYRGQLEPRTNAVDYLVFVSFFPQLVAGPIERAKHLLPQIENERTLTFAKLESGLSLALWGAFKKVVIADTLSPFVGSIFAHPDPSGPMIWAASLGFSIQLFADFSAYTDIARGTARMLGFELVENFREPFLARSPSEFWGRWHISFANWIRDYLFYPLALSKWCRTWLIIPGIKPTGQFHMMRGMVLALLLSGFWHGASWHFVLWGGLFAVLQLAYYFIGRRLPRSVREWPHADYFLVPLMFFFATLSSLIFREPNIARIGRYLTLNPFSATPDEWQVTTVMVTITLATCVPMLAVWQFRKRVPESVVVHPAFLPVRTTLWCVASWMLYVFAKPVTSDFVYFQF